MAVEKLYQLFHIEKLLICSGGTADWTFLRAGMIDELSMVLRTVTNMVSVFLSFNMVDYDKTMNEGMKILTNIPIV